MAGSGDGSRPTSKRVRGVPKPWLMSEEAWAELVEEAERIAAEDFESLPSLFDLPQGTPVAAHPPATAGKKRRSYSKVNHVALRQVIDRAYANGQLITVHDLRDLIDKFMEGGPEQERVGTRRRNQIAAQIAEELGLPDHEP